VVESEIGISINVPLRGSGVIMTATFAQLGLPNSLVRSLEQRGILEPFPVQEATIPDALSGKDVSGKAPTGSGKTIAFGLPLLARVERAKPNRPRGLVLAPTRELADQIKQELAPLAQAVGRNVFAIYGGVGYGPQRNAMRRGVDVLVATPGRLEDLIEQRTVDLSQADIVVVDEADRMADMGFLPAVRRILDRTAKRRQTLLFSATLDGDIAVLSRSYQHDPVRHDAGNVDSEAIDAKHHFWLVEHHDRVEHTADLIKAADRSIVFTRTRHGADRLAKQLSKLGVTAVAMHGGRSQNQRNRALQAFSTYRAQALIATDVAARGIHIDAVASVIHFDPPTDHKDYLHRSGRTARAGVTGTVVSLVTGDQKRAVRRMQKELDLDAPIEPPELEALDHGGTRIGEPSTNGSRPAPRRPQGSRSDERQARPSKRSEKPSSGSATKKGGESVYVANLPWGTTESDVARMFERFGDVNATTLIFDRRTGRSKGFGFVDMPRPAARIAVDALHGTKMGGRDLTVRLAKPRAGRR
jgi:superfamily II DNA/RNA helicase